MMTQVVERNAVIAAEHNRAQCVQHQAVAPWREAQIVVDRLVIEPQRREEEHELSDESNWPQTIMEECKPGYQPRDGMKTLKETFASRHSC